MRSRNKAVPENFGVIVGSIIRDTMLSKNLKKSEVVNRLDIPRSSVHDIIDGKIKKPSFWAVFRIVTDGLGVKYSTFAKKMEAVKYDFLD